MVDVEHPSTSPFTLYPSLQTHAHVWPPSPEALSNAFDPYAMHTLTLIISVVGHAGLSVDMVCSDGYSVNGLVLGCSTSTMV